MLELCGMTKLYSGIPAVTDISFSALPGEVTGYLGPNGSGKSKSRISIHISLRLNISKW